MYYTYILISDKDKAYYIGYSSSYKERLIYHNSNKVLSTKNRGPWKIFHVEVFHDEISAIRRERQIKSWKSRKAIEKLKFCNKIEDPRFRQKLSKSGPQANV